ncbi:hypothetical protein [Allochromatium vinosum]|uniref:Uncharacterized protein n=1 Tax=Allochromatium vinosum (strain ATCC 17899 / DSM 180 / NBRC 103801 / NCIMB 10441 / D) TaxID=572477 RepID=D3RWE7_ALLVD|nr:hypothetical protein [Allochromatium vinosum]ADC64159.1 hypothetical protein Alvin_3268 [Allochromatium vinosum DSM 180]
MRHAPQTEQIQQRVWSFFKDNFSRYIDYQKIDRRSEIKRYILWEIGSYAHDFGYKTYAAKEIGSCVRGEPWIYDLHWGADSESCPLIRLPLVMEVVCDEWNPSQDQRIIDAFLKLMQSKADIRLMVFERTDVQEMQEYLCTLIEQFEGTQPGDRYWIIGWDTLPLSPTGLKCLDYRA